MTIQATQIDRDEFGYWTHPEYPEWDEDTAKDTIDQWLADNHIDYSTVWMESDGDDELLDRYFDEGDIDISAWQPVCNQPGAFLLSIHDTESGAVAIFAIPNAAETPA